MDDGELLMEMYKAKAIVIEKEAEIEKLQRRIEEMDIELQERNRVWEAIRNIQKSMKGAETQKLEETEIIKRIHDRVTALEETDKFDRVERRLEEITARLERNEAENVQKGMEELKAANAHILERMATWEDRIKEGNETKEEKSVAKATADWSVSAVVKPSTHRGTKLSNGTRGIKLGDMSLSRETKQRRGTEEEEKEEDEDEENESDSEKEIPKKKKTSPQRDLETYNILIVGETGVGKTTFINGMANYVGFDTWEKALRYGPDILVKTQFTLVNKDMKPVTVLGRCSFEETNDEKKNENLGSSGGSVTQKPVTHTLIWKGKSGSVNVNLIDTPGMNYTRGSKQDQFNLQKILDHVRELKQLNAIVLLLSADQPQMTLQFRHSLNEFLANFDKSSLGNLIFCFTKTRPFGYRPGDAIPVLRVYLGEQMKRCGADDLLERDNVFCFDNECFRYMCMTKQFPDCGSSDLNKEFRDCWEHNKIEIKRLMRKISKLEAYKLNELTDVSKLREIVDTLSLHQATFSKATVACIKECERIFAQLKDNYEQFAAETMYKNTPKGETQVNNDIDRLLAVMKVKQAEQEELKQERWQIFDLCAEIRIHIKYKSPTMPADSFRMYLIGLIEDVESKQRQGGSFPKIIEDLQSVLEYYDRKVMEVGDAVQKKARNILTECEIEGKLLDLRRLKHYGEVVDKAIVKEGIAVLPTR